MSLQITEGELTGDIRSVLDSIERGDEIIIEREDHRPVALMTQPAPVGRRISDCIGIAKALEEKSPIIPVRDSDFARDVLEGVNPRLQPIRNVWDH